MTAIILSRQRRYRLRQQLKHAQDAPVYRRTLAILEIGQGKPAAEVADAPAAGGDRHLHRADACSRARPH